MPAESYPIAKTLKFTHMNGTGGTIFIHNKDNNCFVAEFRGEPFEEFTLAAIESKLQGKVNFLLFELAEETFTSHLKTENPKEFFELLTESGKQYTVGKDFKGEAIIAFSGVKSNHGPDDPYTMKLFFTKGSADSSTEDSKRKFLQTQLEEAPMLFPFRINGEDGWQTTPSGIKYEEYRKEQIEWLLLLENDRLAVQLDVIQNTLRNLAYKIQLDHTQAFNGLRDAEDNREDVIQQFMISVLEQQFKPEWNEIKNIFALARKALSEHDFEAVKKHTTHINSQLHTLSLKAGFRKTHLQMISGGLQRENVLEQLEQIKKAQSPFSHVDRKTSTLASILFSTLSNVYSYADASEAQKDFNRALELIKACTISPEEVLATSHTFGAFTVKRKK